MGLFNLEHYEFSEKMDTELVVDFIIEKIFLFCNNPNKQTFNAIIQEVIENKYWTAPLFIFNVRIDKRNTLLLRKAYTILREYVPKDERYNLFCNYYIRAGYDFPKYLIKEIAKFRPKNNLEELPDEFKDDEILTVYRASQVSPLLAFGKVINAKEVAKEYSWSISPSVALFHWEARMKLREPRYLYQGCIKRKDVIAFLSPCSEKEILQCEKVFDIEWREVNPFRKLCEMEEAIGTICAQDMDRYGTIYHWDDIKKPNI